MTLVTVLALVAAAPIFYACRGDRDAQALLFVMFAALVVPLLILGLLAAIRAFWSWVL